eukprot:CAMPEP_0182859064 /NCGR_PEP_ID=MMETSP0034_2-20130328/4052_1 /TAXON_ID=156128 /ORGANISM="Nephroselmis pyriformis, Strain CCMP717" /LENGTH=511 /DNA_ID=CAMNT_0024990585 /DNA_START=79 /DNA_END=1614 /DNA_ORIENTATION=-
MTRKGGGTCRVYNLELIGETVRDAAVQAEEIEKNKGRAMTPVPAAPPADAEADAVVEDAEAEAAAMDEAAAEADAEAAADEPLAIDNLYHEDFDHSSSEVRRLAKELKQRQYEEQISREMERRIAEAAQRREAAFHEMYTRVSKGMDGDDGIVAEINAQLDRHDAMKQKKKEGLHAEWTEQVFGHVQGQIEEKLAARSIEEIETRLRAQATAFLETVNIKSSNPKAGVYRDIIMESDYDPFTWKAHTIKASTAGMEDPIKRDVLKTVREKAEIGLLEEQLTGGRETLRVVMWDKLDSTPYGHFTEADGTLTSDVDPDALEKHGRSLGSVRGKSTVTFNDFEFPKGKAAVDAELPKGKGMVEVPPKPGQRSDGLFTVLNHRKPEITNHELRKQGETMGDRWLAAKGKKSVTVELDHSGRQDLFDLVNHTCYNRPELTGGDQWLEYKGKGRADPPTIPGRKDLFDVINQRQIDKTNKELQLMGHTMGDAWLEAKGKKFVEAPKPEPSTDPWVD